MSTEKLIVEIDVKTQKLAARLDDAEKKLDDVGDAARKTDQKTSSLSRGFKTLETGTEKLSSGIGRLATGLTALGAAAMASAKLLGDMSKEIRLNAELSKLGAEEFQLYAHAMREQGIGIEKLGDITKDTSERLGEFLNTGGGALDDFAQAMGYSTEQTRQFALEMQNVSGIEVLQEIADRMYAVGASETQVSAALEAMASDTTALIPLLEDGGKKMGELMDEAERSNIVFSSERLAQMEAMGKQVDLLGRQSQQTAALGLSAIGAELMAVVAAAPATIKAIQSISQAVGTMLAAGFADLMFNASDWWDKLKSFQSDIEGGFSGLVADGLDFLGFDSSYFRDQEQAWANYGDYLEQQREIQRAGHEEGMRLLEEQIDGAMNRTVEAIEEAKNAATTAYQEFEDLKISADNADSADAGQDSIDGPGGDSEKTQAEKLAEELAEVRARWAQHTRLVSGIHQKGFDLFKKYEDDKVRASADALEMIASATASNSKTMFYVQQGVKAGMTVMNTAEGIMEASPNIPLMTMVGLTGAAQLAAIMSATPNGGSSSPAPVAAAPAAAQSDFEADTQGLDASGSIAFGGETVGDVSGSISVEVDGDSMTQMLGGILQKGLDEGSIKLKGT